MKKIDKLLLIAKGKAQGQDAAAIARVLERLSTDDLEELAYSNPNESRIHEILASVDGLHLLESG